MTSSIVSGATTPQPPTTTPGLLTLSECFVILLNVSSNARLHRALLHALNSDDNDCNSDETTAAASSLFRQCRRSNVTVLTECCDIIFSKCLSRKETNQHRRRPTTTSVRMMIIFRYLLALPLASSLDSILHATLSSATSRQRLGAITCLKALASDFTRPRTISVPYERTTALRCLRLHLPDVRACVAGNTRLAVVAADCVCMVIWAILVSEDSSSSSSNEFAVAILNDVHQWRQQVLQPQRPFISLPWQLLGAVHMTTTAILCMCMPFWIEVDNVWVAATSTTTTTTTATDTTDEDNVMLVLLKCLLRLSRYTTNRLLTSVPWYANIVTQITHFIHAFLLPKPSSQSSSSSSSSSSPQRQAVTTIVQWYLAYAVFQETNDNDNDEWLRVTGALADLCVHTEELEYIWSALLIHTARDHCTRAHRTLLVQLMNSSHIPSELVVNVVSQCVDYVNAYDVWQYRPSQFKADIPDDDMYRWVPLLRASAPSSSSSSYVAAVLWWLDFVTVPADFNLMAVWMTSTECTIEWPLAYIDLLRITDNGRYRHHHRRPTSGIHAPPDLDGPSTSSPSSWDASSALAWAVMHEHMRDLQPVHLERLLCHLFTYPEDAVLVKFAAALGDTWTRHIQWLLPRLRAQIINSTTITTTTTTTTAHAKSLYDQLSPLLVLKLLPSSAFPPATTVTSCCTCDGEWWHMLCVLVSMATDARAYREVRQVSVVILARYPPPLVLSLVSAGLVHAIHYTLNSADQVQTWIYLMCNALSMCGADYTHASSILRVIDLLITALSRIPSSSSLSSSSSSSSSWHQGVAQCVMLCALSTSANVRKRVLTALVDFLQHGTRVAVDETRTTAAATWCPQHIAQVFPAITNYHSPRDDDGDDLAIAHEVMLESAVIIMSSLSKQNNQSNDNTIALLSRIILQQQPPPQ